MTIRGDVVGSLLRPPYLVEARTAREAGRLAPATFKRVEDRAVDEAVALQDAAGLDVVSDGELRRYAFFGHLVDAVDGFDKFGGWAVPFRDDEGFLLEYDDERSGGFEPLRAMPPDREVVLGLVTTKKPRLESVDELRRRIDEAARYVSLDRLALSPQCGFASTMAGNLISPERQREKLARVAKTARLVWGHS